MKFTYESVKEYISSQGYKLLSVDYINSQHPLQIECPNGHTIKPAFSEFKRKARCNECSRNKKPTIEQIQEFINPKNFKVLSKEYINNNTKIDVQCPLGHVWGITWINLKNGNGCPDCFGNRKHTLEEVKAYLQNDGYVLVDNVYKNLDTIMKMICPKNHVYETRFHDFKNGGSRCPSCSHQTSNAEQEILTFIKQYYPNAHKTKYYKLIENCPEHYRNKELDIYIPELRLAIEYCGLYWHSDASGDKLPKHHRQKLDWCRDNSIRLITIFEDEWLTRQEQVKNLLLSVLGIHKHKIAGRKCEVKFIDKKLAREFVNTYHIQPLNAHLEAAFGLYFKEELVGVITGSKHHRQNNNSLVLQRLCFKTEYQIQGGASKLFKRLIEYGLNNFYKDIISWSDNRISEGNVYEKLNFQLLREYNQDYSYVLDGYYTKRHSKQSLKKTKEERNSNKTEYELRREQNYYRIWDCGKKAWHFNLIFLQVSS